MPADLPPLPPPFVCNAPRAVDGDTIACGARRIRLLGIDAADSTRSSPCRQHRARYVCDDRLAARHSAALRRLLAGGGVHIEPVTFDRYRRIVAVVRVRGVNASCAMLQVRSVRYRVDYDDGRRIAGECR